MKRIIVLFSLLVGLLSAQGRVSTYPVWHGFQQIADDQIFNTTGGSTETFKASEILGVATLWIETTSVYTGTVTVTVYVQNEKANSQCESGSFTITNLNSGGNVVSITDYLLASDNAFIVLSTSTGQFTADVYIGTE